jgi:hypothetical protein
MMRVGWRGTFLELSWAGYSQGLSALRSILVLLKGDVVVGRIPAVVICAITSACGRRVGELDVATAGSGGVAVDSGCSQGPVDSVSDQNFVRADQNERIPYPSTEGEPAIVDEDAPP